MDSAPITASFMSVVMVSAGDRAWICTVWPFDRSAAKSGATSSSRM